MISTTAIQSRVLVIEDHHGVASYLGIRAAYERPVSDVLVSRIVVCLLQEEGRCRASR